MSSSPPDTRRVPSPEPTPDAARPRRRWPTWVRALLVPVVWMFANYVLALPVIAALAPFLEGLDPFWGQAAYHAATLLVPATALVICFLLMRHVDRRPLRDAGLFVDARSVPGFLVGLVGAAVAVVPLGFALQALGMLRDAQPIPDAPLWVVLAVGVFPALLVQGFPEELTWRGWLMQTLPWRSPWAIVLWSSALFAVLHLVSNGGQENLFERFLYPVQAFGFAFLGAALYRATGQLWAAVGVHGGMHLSHYTTGYLGVGGGPVLWVGETVAYVVLSVLVMVWCDRRRTHDHLFVARSELPDAAG